ncbi:hypothetical protein BGZ65_011058, partial [Modicella reniformis]
MIVGVLAILKAGGSYVPLDPTYASERLQDILKDSTPDVVVADKRGRSTLGAEALSSMTVVDPIAMLDTTYETERSTSDCHASNPRVSGLFPSNLAYIIYTSGSTGKPKGVMVEHQGVVNLVHTRPDVCGINSSSRVTQFFSFGFDGCAQDIFMTLCCGGSLHLLPDHIRSDPAQLWNYLEKQSITQSVLTPAILQDCKNFPLLTTPLILVIAGEALPAPLLRALQTLVPNGSIVNDYGPTEATVSSIAWKTPRDFDSDIVPVGRPIANKRVYILNQYGQPVPTGATGELYIGGVGIARGYLNRPELSAKVFLPDPFASEPNARMYKTGDMARYLPDGNIEFLGRDDHQVKLRGFRIELGEVEARLVDHPLVDKSVVIATGQGSDKRLVAYVVAEHGDQLVSTLRSHLTSCLPDYMVPTAIVRMDSFPLTSNGKLDRKALLAPHSDAFARQTYEEPQGEIETIIAQIWSELLHID